MAKGFKHGGGEPIAGFPKYTYTGEHRFSAESGDNWKLELLTGGTLTFTKLGNAKKGIDAFLVGGGSGAPYSGTEFAGGGAGGYARTVRNIPVAKNAPITVVIGAGGAAAQTNWSAGGRSGDGGVTSFAEYRAAGGEGQTKHSNYRTGCSGGTGGQIYEQASAIPATDGADGSASGKGQRSTPGPNGESGTTGEFGNEKATLYSNGGCYGGTPRPNSGDAGRSADKRETIGTAGAAGIVILRNARG